MNKIKTFSLALLFAASSSFAQQLYTDGHADGLAVSFTNNNFYFHFYAHTDDPTILDGNPHTNPTSNPEDPELNRYAPGAIVTYVPSSVEETVVSNFPEAGVGPGDKIWILPQNNPDNSPALPDVVPWSGVRAEDLQSGDWTGLNFELLKVDSPSDAGTYSLWETDAQNNLTFYFSGTEDPDVPVIGTVLNDSLTDDNNRLPSTAGAHEHFNQGFNETGRWEITYRVSGTHITEGFQEATATYVFDVVTVGPVIPTMTEWSIIFLVVAILYVAMRQLRLSTIR